MSGGKKGFYLRKRQRKYPLTSQQMKFKRIAKECGLYKGINKKELQKLMVECIGPKLRKN